MDIEFQLFGKTIADKDLREFEGRHGVTLPDDYRRFMRACNGGMPVPIAYETHSPYEVGLLQLYSLNDDFPYDLDRTCVSTDWEEGYGLGYLQIGHDQGGSGIFLSTRGEDRGSIYFFEKEETLRFPEGAVKIADSFKQFILSLRPVPSPK